MRQPHILSPNEKNTIPQRMIFFDSESHVKTEITEADIEKVSQREKVEKEHTPYLICATFRHINSKGNPKEKEVDYLGDHDFLSDFWNDVDGYCMWKKRTYMFAHNAKYDTLVTACVPQLVINHGWEVEGFSDSNPFIVRLSKFKHRKCGSAAEKKRDGITCAACGEVPVKELDKKTLIILSSTNYYQTSLKELGKIFNLPKLDFEHGQPFLMDDAVIYCRRDVDILKAAMLDFMEFIKLEDLGNFSITVAGQAFNSFRHRFMQHDIYIHSDENALAVERRCYAGGRNECFSMGEVDGDIYGQDVNSMYPAVMRTERFPTKLITFQKKMTMEEVQQVFNAGYLVCADTLIETTYPIFHKKDGKLIFPIGRYWTSLSTPEIEEAITRGLLREIKNVAVYEGKEIFAPYVDYFYTKRLEAKSQGNAVFDYLYKIFLNSLYGKFGQKNINWDRVGDSPREYIGIENVADVDEGTNFLIKIFGGGIFKRNDDPDDEEAFNSFPAVAAHVTAHARMKLWRYIETAGIENTHYTDTDSLFTNLLGYERMIEAGHIDEKKLGLLKLEKVVTHFVVYGCKDYEYYDPDHKDKDTGQLGKTFTKTKGVTKSSLELEPDAEGHKRFISTVWGGFAEGMRNKNLAGYKNRLMIKTLKREYTKGIVAGQRVIPFTYSE